MKTLSHTVLSFILTGAALIPAACGDMTYDGKADWRLPTLYEHQEANSHGFYALNNAYWNPLSDKTANPTYFTATAAWWSIGGIFYHYLDQNRFGDNPSGNHQVVCVRNDAG
ncbi:MAG: hypothetical protein H7249_04950 [Chitinophagaceae bacterium]|nr:hypothetical protein [Oligoflexus sp.]